MLQKLIYLVIVVIVFNISSTKAESQSEATLKQLEDLTERIQNCGQNLQCIQKLSNEMQKLQQEFNQQFQSRMGLSSQLAKDKPCRIVVPPFFCIPITVSVKNHSVWQQIGYIHSGVLPDEPKKYIANFVEFRYTAEALGELIHTEDFSEFQAVVVGKPEFARIITFHGYSKSTDLYKNIHHRQYNTSGATIRRSFTFGFHYPDDEMSQNKWTNMMLTPAEAETHDDWLPSFSGSRINGWDKGVGPVFHITPDVIKKIVAAGGFEKTYKWRDIQPGGNDWVDNDLTIKVALKSVCDQKMDVKILKPGTGKGDYSFSTATQGKLKIELHAKVTPAEYSTQLEWIVPALTGSKRTFSPHDGRGSHVTVTYTGMPAKNSDFGEKEITVTLKVKNCKAEAKAKVRLFFPRDAKNNPDGKVPNWFYYWSQTKARLGKAKYGGKSGQCGSSAGRIDGLLGFHQDKQFKDFYYICDLGRLGKEFLFQEAVQWPKGGKPSMVQVKGIDTFAVVSHHENAHLFLTQWWNKYRTNNPKVLNIDDLNKNHVPDTIEFNLDKDQDRIPNTIEISYGLNPKKKYTYPSPVKEDDEELWCWMKELEGWTIGQWKFEDWACPGSNAASCPQP